MTTHIFDVEEAAVFGLHEAIALNRFRYWIEKNEANGKHFYDGRTWTYNSAEAMKKLFPYWTAPQIRRLLKSMIAKKILVTGNYNQTSYNRTLWYALGDAIILPSGENHLTKPENGENEKDKTYKEPLLLPEDKPVLPASEKDSQKKKGDKILSEVQVSDLKEWIEEQAKAGIELHLVDIPLELAKCKSHFHGKPRKIGTARTWLLNSVGYAKQRLTPQQQQPAMPAAKQAPLVGSPEWHAQQRELGLE